MHINHAFLHCIVCFDALCISRTHSMPISFGAILPLIFPFSPIYSLFSVQSTYRCTYNQTFPCMAYHVSCASNKSKGRRESPAF
ncbi:hypothetical protein THOM_0213 [Trachipleistophora hominis]|uniref:Transposable element encoded protein n=1 Tax=Trachipleistophora hominis TaxID=72359 RepID=L7JZC4_TRAHO|nr:hypothetical protein THOM_0213 [Trachipleistophora hominis]